VIVAGALQAGAQHLQPATSKSALEAHKVGKYGEVLTNGSGHSPYVLSVESGGKLHCTSALCLKYLPPCSWPRARRLPPVLE
jgi:hypothetical protein